MKVVKFYADWCGPCQKYQNHWDAYVLQNEDEEIEFIDVNVEKPGGAKYKKNVQISSIPLTVVFNEDLEPIRSETGLLRHEQLKELIYGNEN